MPSASAAALEAERSQSPRKILCTAYSPLSDHKFSNLAATQDSLLAFSFRGIVNVHLNANLQSSFTSFNRFADIQPRRWPRPLRVAPSDLPQEFR